MTVSLKAIAGGLVAAVLAITAAAAQERVAAHKDWSVFEASQGGNKICWVVSQPIESVATRGGQQVEVQRGQIFLMVSVRPGDGVANEVSFLSGYPFKGGSTVKVSVGSREFTLFTEGENAWTSSTSDDATVTNAFRRGAQARIEGLSQRGTTTRDTFSLSGFTAAMRSATQRCS